MKDYKHIETSFDNFMEIDERFSTCSVKVMYVGKNRNGSFFTKDSVEKSLESLKNMPVVGEFKSDKDDFGSHGGKLEITEEAITLVPTTRPYGVIPETFEHEWIEEDIGDGRIKETLVIHNVILWTNHYEEAFNVLIDGSSQSMEIEVKDGIWNEEFEVYQINDFNFLSLCILGKDVEPAFENSRFYSYQKAEFKKEWDEMLKELSYSLSQKEDNILDANKSKELEVTENEFENTENETVVEDVETVVEDTVVEETVETVEVTDEVTPENETVVEDTVIEDEVTPEGESVVEDVETDSVVEDTVDTVETDVEDYQSKIVELESQVASLSAENESLKQFKQDAEKASHKDSADKIFNRFSLDEEDVKDLNIFELTLEEIEEKCYAIIGCKASSDNNFSLDNKNKAQKISIDKIIEDNGGKDEKYGDLFEKYGINK